MLTNLAYLHEHGCPWDRMVFVCAIEKGYGDVLDYVLDHGCPHDRRVTLKLATLFGRTDVFECVRHHVHPTEEEVDACMMCAVEEGDLDMIRPCMDHRMSVPRVTRRGGNPRVCVRQRRRWTRVRGNVVPSHMLCSSSRTGSTIVSK